MNEMNSNWCNGGTGKFSEWDPELTMQFLRIPNAPNYAAVLKLIENASALWMEEFLQKGGLAALFDNLEKLSVSSGGDKLLNTLLQLEAVKAVRAVLNSKVGLEYLLTQRQFTRQLIQGNISINLIWLVDRIHCNL